MDPLDLIRDGKIRRYFRAKCKLNVPGLVFHITQRGAGKEPLFIEDEDYLSMIWRVKEVAAKRLLEIYCFCLMPNHVHLLASASEANLFDAMRDLFAWYAARFNQKYERKGHLFGGPYRQAICLDDAYLLAASLYIHLNPVRAAMVEDPAIYRWSSYRLYDVAEGKESFVKPDLVLGLLSDDSSVAKRRYRELAERAREIDARAASEDRKAIESFLTALGQRMPAVWHWLERAAGHEERSGKFLEHGASWEEGLEAVQKEGFRRRPEARQAVRHLIEQMISRGYRREEIAEKLGVSRKTVYNLLKPVT